MNSGEPDRFVHFDAAYLAGALSEQDRHDYEQHLRHCTRCMQAVADLAGIPDLIAKVPETEATIPREPAPATLLPSLLAAARRERYRRRAATVAGWLLAAAASVALAVVLSTSPTRAPAPAEAAPTATMTRVVAAPIHGTTRLDQIAGGTKVSVRCGYEYGSRTVPYMLVVVGQDGKPRQVGSWNAAPGHTYDIQGTTALPRRDITAVEVRLTDGTPVLRWTP
jgi:hypothetical protein